MAASLVTGAAKEARRAAIVEREERLAAAMETASAEARAMVARLLEIERENSERRAAAAAEIEMLNRTAGDVLLDATLKGEGQGAATRLDGRRAKLRAELEDADSRIGAARERRERAVREVFRVEAEALRALAAPLVIQAEELERETEELLTLVELRKGIRPIFPGPSTSGRSGPVQAPSEFKILTEVALRAEVADLEQQAGFRAGAHPRTNGTVEADSVDELLARMLADPLVIAPCIADVRTWAAAIEAGERDRRRRVEDVGGTTVIGYISPAAPVRFRMAWAEGRIDVAESGVVRTGPTIEEALTDEQQDRLVERDADLVDRALAWLEQHGGDLRSAVARAEAVGHREGVAARGWAKVLQAEGLGVVEVEDPGHLDADLDDDAEAIG